MSDENNDSSSSTEYSVEIAIGGFIAADLIVVQAFIPVDKPDILQGELD